MTGYTVHTGSSKKFASGWDNIFKGRGATKKTPAETRKGSDKPARKKKK